MTRLQSFPFQSPAFPSHCSFRSPYCIRVTLSASCLVLLPLRYSLVWPAYTHTNIYHISLIWLGLNAEGLKSLFLISVYTVLQSSPSPCFRPHTCSWFLTPCILFMSHHRESWIRATWCSSSFRLANSYPPFKTELKCHLFCEAFPQQSRQKSALLWALATHTHHDFHLISLYLMSHVHVFLCSLHHHTHINAFDLNTSWPKQTASGLVLRVTLEQAHSFLLPAVDWMPTRISFTCSHSSLCQFYLLLSLFNLINIIYNEER